jgi:polo-like kinase 1
MAEYPKDMQKKVTLLQHFRSYLDNGVKEKSKSADKVQIFYIKKWMRTKHAIMFRLSNKLIQVIFEDKTEIILYSESKEMTYLNKRGERESYPLATALDSENREMTKRLKYTKDILSHMLASTGSRSHKEDKGRLNKEKLIATARGGLKENI